MNSMNTDEESVRVNGATIQEHNGKQVILLGELMKVDANGSSLQMKASDGQVITVKFQRPLMEPVQGMLEIYGITQGKQILGHSYCQLPVDEKNPMDLDAYDQVVTLIHSVPSNPWKKD